jgi:hypothetical protein
MCTQNKARIRVHKRAKFVHWIHAVLIAKEDAE